jgi:hypothetical protein
MFIIIFFIVHRVIKSLKNNKLLPKFKFIEINGMKLINANNFYSTFYKVNFILVIYIHNFFFIFKIFIIYYIINNCILF